MHLALLTIAAKKCQSSPARCAKTSTFSPSTSPSIDMETMCTCRWANKQTHTHTHTYIPCNEAYNGVAQLFIHISSTATHSHIPLIQLDIPMQDLLVRVLCKYCLIKPGVMQKHMYTKTETHKSWNWEKRKLMLIFLCLEMGYILA